MTCKQNINQVFWNNCKFITSSFLASSRWLTKQRFTYVFNKISTMNYHAQMLFLFFVYEYSHWYTVSKSSKKKSRTFPILITFNSSLLQMFKYFISKFSQVHKLSGKTTKYRRPGTLAGKGMKVKAMCAGFFPLFL